MTDPSNTRETAVPAEPASPVEQTPGAAVPMTRREARALERAAAAAADAGSAAPASTTSSAAPVSAPSSAAPPTAPVAAAADAAPASAPSSVAPATSPTMNPVSNDAPTSNRVHGSEVGATAAEAAPTTSVARRPRASVPAVLRRTRDAGRPNPSPRATPGRSRLRAVSSRVRAATLPVLGVCAVMLFFTSNLTPASASDLGGSNIPTAGAAPMPTQTLAASLVVLTVSDRDAFGVTDAPPPPPPPPEPEPVVTSKNVAGSTNSYRASSGAGTIVNSGIGDIRWPFPGSVVLSSGFGPRAAPCAACSSMHMGLDMTPGGGTPIGAAAAGVVRTSGMHGQFGQYAVIDHVIDGQRVSTLYAHMQIGSSPLVAGQTVQVGELVGKVGRSGVATGEHLHFEVLLGGTTQVDPKAWLEANAGRTL
ncbi:MULTISPECIES: M23 family metallopeptidase [unclassified Frigoribacterium]|uniref:M23 family metallopeptidase n=1 Tax=unclassified Frigoribacterium TaxID=2627005 RepID=UPI0015656239|nr:MULTISPECIES: M23 family metallopeptidase [unclassified Frigoribacterium]NQW87346.1 M23 family metallopeptidase [Frigoribacterium sp. VKM Ac-2860]NQX09844.1 M23 family metallopeptidase [Frigoribacterium sp. VKM Ac-2859]